MCYMKHETAKNNVIVKSKAEKSKTHSKIKKTKSGAEKTAGKIALKPRQPTVKKIESGEKKLNSNVLTRNAKRKVEKTAFKIPVKIVKVPKVKTIISIKKTKPGVKKTGSVALKPRANQKVEKIAPKLSVKQAELKIQKAKIISSAKSVHPAPKKLKTVVSARIAKVEKDDKKFKAVAENSKRQPPKVSVKKAEIEKLKVKMASPIQKIASGGKKTVPVSVTKVNLKTPVKPIVKPVKVRVAKVQTVAAKRVKVGETKIKTVNLPILKTPKKKKIKPISSAVFRGKKDRYAFEVFSLTEEFEPVPAVYVISRRKTDRQKKAHHSLVCIGQTNSIFDEVKKHRNGKCVKKHNANVISILTEGDEKKRLKIETDLKAAHSIACNLQQI